MLLFTAMAMQVASVQAQGDAYALLKKVRDANANKPISYEYKVCKRYVPTGKILDCINGRLYQQGSDYLDSNNYYISSVRKGYYCKLDFKERSAIIFDADEFRKQMGIETNGTSGVIAFPDSIIKKYGQIKLSKTGQGNYKIELTLGAPYDMTSVLDVDKASLLVRAVKIISKMNGTDNQQTEQVYEMMQFNYVFDNRAMDHQRFYKVQADKTIVLTGRFAGFKLNTLTK